MRCGPNTTGSSDHIQKSHSLQTVLAGHKQDRCVKPPPTRQYLLDLTAYGNSTVIVTLTAPGVPYKLVKATTTAAQARLCHQTAPDTQEPLQT